MAEEDIIFGKKRHFFGGIEPSNMLMFNATPLRDVEKDTIGIRLTCKLPKNTVIDNQMICTVSGAVIRRSSEHYPINEFDGVQIADIKEDTVLIDNDVESDITYYYAAFPYSSLDVYNRNIWNRAEATPTTKRSYYFGYDIDLSDPDPMTRVSYPSDVDNADYEPAGMNWSKDSTIKSTSSYAFDYGNWPKSGEKFMPKPCMINIETGEVYKYADPDNMTCYEDGTPISNLDSLAYMIEWPKIYTKREEVDGIYKFRCSDVPEDDTWNCWCNYDENNNIIDHFYISQCYAYTTTVEGVQKLKPNYKSDSARELSISDARTYAKNTGDGLSPFRLVDNLLIQDLLVMMGKTTDTQSRFGYSFKTMNSSTSSKITYNHMFFGFNYDDETISTSNSVFGMIGYMASQELIDGWILKYDERGTSAVQAIKITESMADGSTGVGFNNDGDGYIEIEDTRRTSTTTNFISKMVTTPFGRLPHITEGSSSTYETDAMYIGSMSSGQANKAYIAYKNPSHSITYGYRLGAFGVGFSSSTSGSIHLSYKPPKKSS